MNEAFDIVIADLKSIYQVQAETSSQRARLTDHDIQRWSTLVGQSRALLYDQVATYLPSCFHSSELDFESCDAIVNDIHGVITFADESRPDLFWAVYLAFDEGEYYHRDQLGEDPVEVYTRPMIAGSLKPVYHDNS
ncbi:MAG: hypothetical protein ACR2JB_24695 [Bryobacteraceae bacterium]